MARREFPAKVKALAFERAKAKGGCELCGLPLMAGRIRYDHILPDALGGEPTLENCSVQCLDCDKPKTANDVRMIRKADRQKRAHIGAVTKAGPKMQSRGFAKGPRRKPASDPLTKPLPPRRGI